MMRRIAALIAIRQLASRPHRSVGGCIGVGAAIVLLTVQIGMRSALYESAVRLHRSLDADLVIVNPRFVSLSNQPRFPIEYLYRAGSSKSIVSARPLYSDAVPWRNPATGITRLIFLFGIDPSRPVLNLAAVNEQIDFLKERGIVLFDALSRREFGPIVAGVKERGELTIALSTEQRSRDPWLRVKGLFSMGPTFVVDGNIIASDLTFHDLTNVSLDRVTIGVLKVDKSEDVAAVARLLSQYLGPEVQVMTKAQFVEMEKKYWADNTSLGFIFDLGLIIGFFVGVVFEYQVLYTLIYDHLKDYSVLKSLGHTDTFLAMVVLLAGLVVAVGALIPFGAIGLGVCALASHLTALDVRLSLEQAGFVGVCVLLMCLSATAVAVRQLRESDPVDLFG